MNVSKKILAVLLTAALGVACSGEVQEFSMGGEDDSDTKKSNEDGSGEENTDDTGDTGDTGADADGTGGSADDADTGVNATDDDNADTGNAVDTGNNPVDTGAIQFPTDNGNVDTGQDPNYECPAAVPDADPSDGSSPSCAQEGADHVNCAYDGGTVCICGGAANKADMVWQCITCPESASDGAVCDVTGLECGYSDGNDCVCVRNGANRAWSCTGGGSEQTEDTEVDTGEAQDTAEEDTTPYECPASQPDADSSCAGESDDHVNCAYDDAVCICGGAANKEDMIWQCNTCPGTVPASGDVCDVTGLECAFTEDDASCVCVRVDNTSREWVCN